MNSDYLGGAKVVTPEALELGLEDCAAALSDCRYLMVVPVPWFKAPDGSVWLDDLWHRDLMRHLDYIKDMTVLAPCRPGEDMAGLVPVDPGLGLKFRALPWGETTLQGLLRAPATLLAALRAVLAADLVHSGVAGWPFPPGLFVNPLAVLFRRPMVIVVESAFWRLTGPGPHKAKARLRAAVVEGFAKWSVRRAALSVFTHEGYRRTLASGQEDRSMVTPATWITKADILDATLAEAAWDAKTLPVRVILPARLTEGKGVDLLIQAMSSKDAADLNVSVDVIGDGPLRAQVTEAAARLGPDRLRLLDPVPYGAPFMGLLRGYHAVLVPSITDEQPRILFDAAAQAVPVLASDTEGHSALIREGVNGWRFEAANATALLKALRQAGDQPLDLRRVGLTARVWAEGWTHDAMHLARARRLAALRRDRSPPKAALPVGG